MDNTLTPSSHELKGHFSNLIEQYCSAEWKWIVDQYKTVKTFDKNQIIFSEKEKIKDIAIIHYGKAKVYATYGNDQERIVRFATDGQVLGHRGIGEDYTFTVSAVALEKTEVCRIPLNIFNRILKANHEFCYQFMLFFAEELRRSERKMKYLTTLDVQQRVAQSLIMNYEAFGFDKKQKQKLSFTISRKDIANLAGTTYESVIRVLSDFNKRQLIKIDGKAIHILQLDTLYTLSV